MPERKIWEFKNRTICTILGLTFDEKELGSIFKKLKLDQDHATPYEMHGSLVRACDTQNRTSRQLDKILKDRFGRYKKELERISQEEIYKYIGNGNSKNIPLPALIWFAVRNQHEEIDKIEAGVFAAVHIYEHRASRFYDTLQRALPDGTPEHILNELNDAVASNEKLQRKCNRLERKREQLKSEIESLKEDRSKINAALQEQKQLNRRLREEFERAGGENALDQIDNLKKEVDLLTGEVTRLTGELIERDRRVVAASNTEFTDIGHVPELDIEDKGENLDLNGIRVAYVGGVESLMQHYKDVVESFGGTFCYHCGRCIQGRKEIETLVDKTDIIFCPVDINSHNACRYVKKACKLRNKPCHFLRSSSISMLIRELENRVEQPDTASAQD